VQIKFDNKECPQEEGCGLGRMQTSKDRLHHSWYVDHHNMVVFKHTSKHSCNKSGNSRV